MRAAANQDPSVEYFGTYEAREEVFRNRVDALIPRKYGGPSLFWEDFRQISFDRSASADLGHHAYITSNPRDCLAYATPGQVLGAAVMQARANAGGRPESAESVAERFGIGTLLGQPIRSLSGGETVKLALAKSFLEARYSCRLTIASPFSWLSAGNSNCFQEVCERYRSLEVPVEILALTGEDTVQVIDHRDPFADIGKQEIAFDLTLDGVQIPLGTLMSDLHGPAARAKIADFESRLRSPCLLVGDNGQGKSLVAKALAGAVAHRGKAHIGNGAEGRRVRLLFQDVVTQTLLRSFENLAAAPAANAPLSAPEAYRQIIGHLERTFAEHGMAPSLESGSSYRSLLEVKAMLIAARLASPVSALILDEPDWGLTRAASSGLVSAVIETAHEADIPLILISHKPWWRSIAASSIEVARSDADIDGTGTFEIQLKVQHGDCQ